MTIDANLIEGVKIGCAIGFVLGALVVACLLKVVYEWGIYQGRRWR